MPRRPDRRTRRFVAERADYRCEYCLTPAGFVPDPYSTEHVLPQSRGGSHAASNLALSCEGCNNRKRAKTTAVDPVTRRVVMMFNPRTQSWHEHFRWTQGNR